MSDPSKLEKNFTENSVTNNGITSTVPSSSEYTKMEQGGLDYIRKKKWYLIVSAAFPIYILIVEVLTASFFMRSMGMNPQFQGRVMYHAMVPSFGGLFILILSIFQFLFLLGWRRKLQIYESQKHALHLQTPHDSSDKEKELTVPEKTMSLTRLFYGIVDHMEKIRILFIIFNLVALYTIFFSMNFFVFNSKPINVDNQKFPIMKWLNFSSSIFLLLYLVFEWFHFIKWNRKLNHLRAFEKKICDELEL
jgi:hypothetical protein